MAVGGCFYMHAEKLNTTTTNHNKLNYTEHTQRRRHALTSWGRETVRVHAHGRDDLIYIYYNIIRERQ